MYIELKTNHRFCVYINNIKCFHNLQFRYFLYNGLPFEKHACQSVALEATYSIRAIKQDLLGFKTYAAKEDILVLYLDDLWYCWYCLSAILRGIYIILL